MRSSAVYERQTRLVRCLNAPSGARWLNVGLWTSIGDRSTVDFSDACQALADAVARLAGLHAGQCVVDVGAGAGEAARRWRTTTGAFVIAIDATRPPGAPLGDLPWLLADGAHLPLRSASIDAILSVDAAYHFRSRARFLRAARRSLRDGGTLVTADVAVCGKRAWLAHLLAPWLGVPRDNLWETARYVAEMQAAGFVECALSDITDESLRSLGRWARRRACCSPDLALLDRLLLALVGLGAALLVHVAGVRFVLARGSARAQTR